MTAKAKIIDVCYKSGAINRYTFQDEIARLHAEGDLSDEEFDALNNEALADAGYAEEGADDAPAPSDASPD